jgi:hypothetical protein
MKACSRWCGWLHLDGWGGRTKQAVVIVDETPKRYRITPDIIFASREGEKSVRLAGRRRSLAFHETALVPKRAVSRRKEEER